MNGNTTMRAMDTLAAGQGECFVTIGTDRFNFMQATNVEAKFEKTKVEIPILGRTGGGNKSTGWKGTGSATFYYNTSIFRKMMEDYKNTGVDTYFDMQITNEDKTSEAGRQTVILIGCNLDGGVLAKFEAGGDALDEDMDFTFEDFRIAEEFTDLPGMF